MTSRTEQVKQVQELRNLCRLMVEQQQDILQQISYKLDALEINLTVSYAEENGDKATNCSCRLQNHPTSQNNSASQNHSTNKGGTANVQ